MAEPASCFCAPEPAKEPRVPLRKCESEAPSAPVCHEGTPASRPYSYKPDPMVVAYEEAIAELAKRIEMLSQDKPRLSGAPIYDAERHPSDSVARLWVVLSLIPVLVSLVVFNTYGLFSILGGKLVNAVSLSLSLLGFVPLVVFLFVALPFRSEPPCLECLRAMLIRVHTSTKIKRSVCEADPAVRTHAKLVPAWRAVHWADALIPGCKSKKSCRHCGSTIDDVLRRFELQGLGSD